MSRIYYRLFDAQVGRFMATGYNATSKAQLAEEYKDYVLAEGDDADAQMFEGLSVEAIIHLIQENEFLIEKNHKKFKDLEL